MEAETELMRVGMEIRSRLRYTREQIIQFARLTGDANPLHHDRQAAERASFGEIIASGQQTTSHLIGLAATQLSRSDDGTAREVLTLNFNFAFKGPVFADQDVLLLWRVSAVEANARRGGHIVLLNGSASVGGRPCVVARGTVLVRRAMTNPVKLP